MLRTPVSSRRLHPGRSNFSKPLLTSGREMPRIKALMVLFCSQFQGLDGKCNPGPARCLRSIAVHQSEEQPCRK